MMHAKTQHALLESCPHCSHLSEKHSALVRETINSGIKKEKKLGILTAIALTSEVFPAF